MKTDKGFYKLFSAAPDMLFEIVGIEVRSTYTMTSLTQKDFEIRSDGYLEPELKSEPVYFVEFQAYKDMGIYQRLFKEAAYYSEQHPERRGKGIIMFTKESIDPKIEPWYGITKSTEQSFRVFYLDETLNQLEKEKPDHPLGFVFKPYLIEDQDVLKRELKEWYGVLESGDLEDAIKDVFCTTFVRWIQERFKSLSYKEIFAMLESLTPIEETKSYKELIAKGEKKGKTEGKTEGKAEGKIEGKIEGEIEGEIAMLKRLYTEKVIDTKEYEKRFIPLRKKLDKQIKNAEDQS